MRAPLPHCALTTSVWSPARNSQWPTHKHYGCLRAVRSRLEGLTIIPGATVLERQHFDAWLISGANVVNGPCVVPLSLLAYVDGAVCYPV
jgi:hypothetical protein